MLPLLVVWAQPRTLTTLLGSARNLVPAGRTPHLITLRALEQALMIAFPLHNPSRRAAVTRRFGQQDPYVKVHVGTQVLRSRVVRGGGVNPTFNQTLLFHVTDRTMTLVLELLDEDLFTDDHLGVATTDLTELIAAGLPPPPPPVAGDDKQLKQPEAAQQQKQPEPQQLTLPVRSRKSGKQHGTITLVSPHPAAALG